MRPVLSRVAKVEVKVKLKPEFPGGSYLKCHNLLFWNHVTYLVYAWGTKMNFSVDWDFNQLAAYLTAEGFHEDVLWFQIMLPVHYLWN